MHNLQKSLILIVDDNLLNLKILGNILEEEYKTAVALNGFEALEFVKKKRPDIILLDITMPEMDGFEVCRLLKENPDTRDIPVIFQTARVDSDNILKGFDMGAADYICKPFNKDELHKRVQMHLTLKNTLEKYKTALETIELSQVKLEAVFQNIPEGIISVDKEKRIIQHNKPLENICSFYRDIETGTRFDKALKKCPGECSKIMLQTLQSKKPVKEYHVNCPNKSSLQKNIILNTSPLLDKKGGFMGAILVTRDVTRIKMLETRLQEQYSFMDIIGKSEKMQRIYALVKQLADVDTTVLVTGESGTGKELVTEAIHHKGSRSGSPLVSVNCSVFSENLLESELFGHVRGAFTGAVKDRDGHVQAAEGGTLFLDEIGDISPYIQLKLLRFLEQKEYARVGDNHIQKADIRIIAATNVDIAKQVAQGQFREDFYYRLKVMNIHLPPLRERTEDIPLLAAHFCQFFSKHFNKNIQGVSDEVLSRFMNYHWPGNVRELKHVIEHAFILCPGKIIENSYLPPEFDSHLKNKNRIPKSSLAQNGTQADKILEALNKTDWNKAKAARLLGIHRGTLYRKLAELNISK